MALVAGSRGSIIAGLVHRRFVMVSTREGDTPRGAGEERVQVRGRAEPGPDRIQIYVADTSTKVPDGSAEKFLVRATAQAATFDASDEAAWLARWSDQQLAVARLSLPSSQETAWRTSQQPIPEIATAIAANTRAQRLAVSTMPSAPDRSIGHVRLFSLDPGSRALSPVRRFDVQQRVRTLAFSPDGRALVGVSDGEVRVWGLPADDGQDPKDFQELLRFTGIAEPDDAWFAPDGGQLKIATSHAILGRWWRDSDLVRIGCGQSGFAPEHWRQLWSDHVAQGEFRWICGHRAP